jgi:hypothetical protein
MTSIRRIAPLFLCLGLALGIAAAHSPPEELFDHMPALPPVQWHLPGGTARVPVVLLLEEPGPAASAGHSPWIGWFLRHGIAVAQIRGDLRAAMELTRRQPRIDAGHFAVMGAGRPAAVALNSARAFADGPMPAAVFALNPPCSDPCPGSYPADGPTRVHVFHGAPHDRLATEIARSRVLETLTLAWQIDD